MTRDQHNYAFSVRISTGNKLQLKRQIQLAGLPLKNKFKINSLKYQIRSFNLKRQCSLVSPTVQLIKQRYESFRDGTVIKSIAYQYVTEKKFFGFDC